MASKSLRISFKVSWLTRSLTSLPTLSLSISTLLARLPIWLSLYKPRPRTNFTDSKATHKEVITFVPDYANFYTVSNLSLGLLQMLMI